MTRTPLRIAEAGQTVSAPLPWRDEETLSYVAAGDIRDIVDARYRDLIDVVDQAYRTHYAGRAVNPDTYSLKFPAKPEARINALPAYAGGAVDLAGLKWVASFPKNVARNRQRASATILVNSYKTGYPLAVLDGTVISAARTAASAALAARRRMTERRSARTALFGAGFIQRELVTLLEADGWRLGDLVVFDHDEASANALIARCASLGIDARHGRDEAEAEACDLVSFATSALEPWYDRPIGGHQTVLHMSLRDIVPARLAPCDNVVDDVDHAVKAMTSLHRLRDAGGAFNLYDFRYFDRTDPPQGTGLVVSAFGMGLLDVAVAAFVLDAAEAGGILKAVPDLRAPSRRW